MLAKSQITHNRIQLGMHIVHRLTRQYGVVLELGLIGNNSGALIQWLYHNGKRDGTPNWALLRNLERINEDR